jgi:hypothetical protein
MYYGYRDSDGIVGPHTWGMLRARLVYRAENGLYSMYSVGASTNQWWRFYGRVRIDIPFQEPFRLDHQHEGEEDA